MPTSGIFFENQFWSSIIDQYQFLCWHSNSFQSVVSFVTYVVDTHAYLIIIATSGSLVSRPSSLFVFLIMKWIIITPFPRRKLESQKSLSLSLSSPKTISYPDILITCVLLMHLFYLHFSPVTMFSLSFIDTWIKRYLKYDISPCWFLPELITFKLLMRDVHASISATRISLAKRS